MALSSRSTHTPWRLDLDWRWHQNALEYGCIFIINPDAHSIRELDHAHWGVEMARKGGVPADRVLNAMPLSKMLAYLAKRKRADLPLPISSG
jgi:DNA polymerase (family 10)